MEDEEKHVKKNEENEKEREENGQKKPYKGKNNFFIIVNLPYVGQP